VCATHRLDELFAQRTAHGLARCAGGWRVETEQGSLEARQVLLPYTIEHIRTARKEE
jgi:hypothetical protein